MKSQARLRLRKPIWPIWHGDGFPVVCSCGGPIAVASMRFLDIRSNEVTRYFRCIDCEKVYSA